MKIVAFLQNMWVREPSKLKAMLARNDEAYRRDMCKRLLFAGCVTGRRLRQGLGDLCDEIIWEECTREIADNPRDILPPQRDHIRAVLTEIQPAIIVAFGRVAASAVFEHGRDVVKAEFLTCCHPAARVRAAEQIVLLRHKLAEAGAVIPI